MEIRILLTIFKVKERRGKVATRASTAVPGAERALGCRVPLIQTQGKEEGGPTDSGHLNAHRALSPAPSPGRATLGEAYLHPFPSCSRAQGVLQTPFIPGVCSGLLRTPGCPSAPGQAAQVAA